MTKSEYRILKLRSGETVIARIKKVDKDNGSVLLHRPMSLKSITILNDFGIPTEEKVCVKRYNDFSTDSVVELPTSYIASVLKPNIRIVEIYDREKVFEDHPELKFIAKKKAEQQAFHEFLQKQKKFEEMGKELGFISNDESSNSPPDFSALMLPNEALQQLMEMMGLDYRLPDKEDELNDLNSNNPPLEEDPEDWEYGCRWQDWDIDDFE